MRKNMTRAGLLGTAGIGAAALAVAGFALPATADDDISSWSSDQTHTSVEGIESFDAFQTLLDDLIDTYGNETTTGDVGIDGGLVDGPLVSDIGNGPVLSGNDVSAPVGSGNDTSVGSGNEVGNGNVVGSGNDTGVSVGDVGAEVGDLTGDIGAQVGDLVGDVSTDVDDLVGGLLD